MKRQYAAGVAILAILLLGSAFGTSTTWVELGSVENDANTLAPQVPNGAAIMNDGSNPPPPPMSGGADDLDYIYLFNSGTGGNYIPWWGNVYTAMRFQTLYLASEVNHTGTIAQAALFKNYYAGYYNTFYNVSVKLCHTTVTTLSSNFQNNYGGGTPVWVYHTASLPRGASAAGVWDTIDFTTPFAYNGTSNLIIEVLWSGRSGSVGIPSYTASGSGNRRCYVGNDTATNSGYADYTAYSCRLGFVGANHDVGVTKIISPADPFYAFGDTIRARIAQATGFGAQTVESRKQKAKAAKKEKEAPAGA